LCLARRGPGYAIDPARFVTKVSQFRRWRTRHAALCLPHACARATHGSVSGCLSLLFPKRLGVAPAVDLPTVAALDHRGLGAGGCSVGLAVHTAAERVGAGISQAADGRWKSRKKEQEDFSKRRGRRRGAGGPGSGYEGRDVGGRREGATRVERESLANLSGPVGSHRGCGHGPARLIHNG
jgi:hypothetical protein